jgi:hypothetical protein
VKLHYRVYGLHLSCDLPIPALRERADALAVEPSAIPDVSVEFGAQPSWARDVFRLPSVVLHSISACEETRDPAFVLTSFGDGQFFQLHYSDGSRFVVDAAATRLWGAAGDSQTLEDLSTYFLGPVMGYVLRRRGITALHASAFCLDGKAVVLAGATGAGKSTSAAALALRGLPVLCEDIAAIEEAPHGFSVQAGYPRVCLWPESVAMLKGNANSLPLITPNWEKRFLPLDGITATHDAQNRPLGAIYILAPREAHHAPRVEEVRSRDVLLELVQNTYMNWLLDRRQRAAEFALLSRLVSHVPVRRIVPHREPARIDVLCDLILSDAARLLANRVGAAASATR